VWDAVRIDLRPASNQVTQKTALGGWFGNRGHSATCQWFSHSGSLEDCHAAQAFLFFAVSSMDAAFWGRRKLMVQRVVDQWSGHSPDLPFYSLSNYYKCGIYLVLSLVCRKTPLAVPASLQPSEPPLRAAE
jgi:hypothetical protein